MKKEYIAPQSEIIKVRLTGSVLQDAVAVNNTSVHALWEDGAKKYRGFDDDEDQMTEGTARTHKSIWDD